MPAVLGRWLMVLVRVCMLNPEMDIFRIGTLLEMVRDIAEALAEDGKKVKVCVQQAMGQGVFQVTSAHLQLKWHHQI